MARGKWIATAASIWIQSSAGSSYAFGIYSSLLKFSQSYDQSTLDTVSFFKDIGANAGILSGFLFAAVSSSSTLRSGGPWVVHLAGAIQCFIGYFFIWAAVTGAIPRPSVPLMCFFMFLAAHAQTFFNTANVVTGVYNFPDYKGTIVGIMKGFLGLSGPVLIQVYQTLFNDNPSSFLLMTALLPTIISLSLMYFVRTCHMSTTVDSKKHLDGFSVTALILAGYLMVLIILENVISFPQWVKILTFVILMFLLLSPLHIALKAKREESDRLLQTLIEKAPLLSDSDPKKTFVEEKDPTEEIEISNSKTENNRVNKSLLQAIQSLNFWLLFASMVCGLGSGLATINNISQIGESLSYSTIEINTLISLWGIWNFLGRFGGGYVSDLFLHKRKWPRPVFMAITLASMSAGHFIISSGSPGNIYIGSILVGICYGSQWSLMPTITSEIFGVRHMGTIFNTLAVASPVGSYVFSVRLMGFLYDKEAFDGSCIGVRCFMLSFFVLACACVLGFLAALALFLRTRRFYRQTIIVKL